MKEILALETAGLQVAYGSTVVLESVDLSIAQKTITGIVGPNGAGKSTLLKAVLGMVPILSGSIRVLGQDVAHSRKRIGYVPQRASVDWDFPITVRDLVTMGSYGRLGWIKRPGTKEHQEATDALVKLKILELENRQIGELSGGQQQRAFLARALMQDAPIYFLDEPFTGVDITTETIMLELLTEMRDLGKTLVIVHHNLTTAAKYMDSAVLLNQEVIASGPVERSLNQENIEAAYGTRFVFPKVR